MSLPKIAARTIELAATRSPSRVCQILAQASAIFLGSPPAEINAYPAVTKLKSAYIPAPTIKSFTMLLINWVGPTYLLTPGGGCTFPNICASLVFM